MKQSYKLVVSLNNPRLASVIDHKKLIFSNVFYEALNYAIQSYLEHKDSRSLEPLINVFESRDYKIFMSNWFCERIGLRAKSIEGSIKLLSSGKAPNEKMSFKVSLADFLSSGMKIQKSKVEIDILSSKEKIKEKKSSSKKIDMLDSWARLPGSYGSGKYR